MTHIGVNLGGWIIPEKWMTPTLFDGTEAKDLYGLLKTDEGKKRYALHLENFITERDFQWLAQNNVSLIRVPFGYWALEDIDGYPNTKKQLDWVMQLAESYHLKVLLDFHAAPGSQNGNDHSAKMGEAMWFSKVQYQDDSLAILKAVATRYRDSPALWGIELLNEPKVGMKNYFLLLSFYRNGYSALRKILRPNTKTVFHDGFIPLLMTGALWARKDFPVVIDMHFYNISSRFASSESRYAWWQKRLLGTIIWLSSKVQPVLIGEWAGVLPQRLFDATPKVEHIHLMRRNITRQQAIYSHTIGWMYWNYDVPSGGMYSFHSLVESGSIRVHPEGK